MPAMQMIPIRPVDNRINAYPQKGYVLVQDEAALFGDETDPLRAILPAVTGFGKHDGLLIALVYFLQQGTERTPAGILILVRPGEEMAFYAIELPLIVIIVIQSDNIQKIGASS